MYIGTLCAQCMLCDANASLWHMAISASGSEPLNSPRDRILAEPQAHTCQYWVCQQAMHV